MKKLSSLLLTLALTTGMVLSAPGSIQSAQAAFADVPADHPYEQGIEFMTERGVIHAYSDNTFKPDQTLSRVVFIQMVVQLAFPADQIEGCLARHTGRVLHIDEESPYAKYLCIAAVNNISNGEDPDGAMIMADAAKIALRAFAVPVAQEDPWYAPYMGKLADLGALPETAADAQHALTRGEASHMLYRLVAALQQVSITDDVQLHGSAETGLSKETISILRLARQLLIMLRLVNPDEMLGVLNYIKQNKSTDDLSLKAYRKSINVSQLQSSVKHSGETADQCVSRCIAEKDLHCQQRPDGTMANCRKLDQSEKEELCKLSCN